MRARARVQSRSNFHGYASQIRAGTDRALDRQGDRALAAIKELAPVGDGRSGVEPGHMRDTLRRSPVQTYKKGRREVNIGSSDPTALYLDLGTLGRRRKKLSKKTLARRNTPSGQARLAKVAGSSGVKARYFFRKGLRAAGMAPGLVAAIKSEVGRSLR